MFDVQDSHAVIYGLWTKVVDADRGTAVKGIPMVQENSLIG